MNKMHKMMFRLLFDLNHRHISSKLFHIHPIWMSSLFCHLLGGLDFVGGEIYFGYGSAHGSGHELEVPKRVFQKLEMTLQDMKTMEKTIKINIPLWHTRGQMRKKTHKNCSIK